MKPTTPVYREKKWLLGLLFLFAGALLSLAVFQLLGQARSSAMASNTLVVNAILAWKYLGETFTRYDLISTVLIIAGVVVSVIFGSASSGASPTYNVSVIVNLLNRDVVFITVGVFSFLFLVSFAYLRWANKKPKASRHRLDLKLECFVRAFVAGIFSGSTGFFTKSVVVCVTNMVKSKDFSDLKTLGFYCFLVGLPVSLGLQLYYLNSGLRRFAALEMIPPYQSSIVAIGALFGFTLFNEAANTPTSALVMFAVGCGISISGIAVLAFKPAKPSAMGTTSAADAEATKKAAGERESETTSLLGASPPVAASVLPTTTTEGDAENATTTAIALGSNIKPHHRESNASEIFAVMMGDSAASNPNPPGTAAAGPTALRGRGSRSGSVLSILGGGGGGGGADSRPLLDKQYELGGGGGGGGKSSYGGAGGSGHISPPAAPSSVVITTAAPASATAGAGAGAGAGPSKTLSPLSAAAIDAELNSPALHKRRTEAGADGAIVDAFSTVKKHVIEPAVSRMRGHSK